MGSASRASNSERMRSASKVGEGYTTLITRAVLSLILLASSLHLPACDNGGLAFRLTDDAAYNDNRAFAVEVIDRNASTLAPVIAA